MAFSVITNPGFAPRTGFTNAQFKQLDDLYCRAASLKTLNFRSVECDFDEGWAAYTYYISAQHDPILQFIIRKVGPQAVHYEVYRAGKGRLLQTTLFDRACERLKAEITEL
ncbi:MAG: hypothetical protein L6Q57_01120 [Alphaproteobacteria bacterium]|nr:hypothetical protein [Alphaproteobacteria bacterium]